MHSQYYRRDLNSNEIDEMFEALVKKWDISNQYWYPLDDTKVTSVIAFKSEEFEKKFGFEQLRRILIESSEIFEIRENRNEGYVVNIETFEPEYEGSGEGFWFNSKMDWIIYCSHEGSITFGGEWLISNIKDYWKEWNKHLYKR